MVFLSVYDVKYETCQVQMKLDIGLGWKNDSGIFATLTDITLYLYLNVMDGDLCEQFTSLDLAKQKTIATDLGRTPNEVAKKLEDIRTRYAF